VYEHEIVVPWAIPSSPPDSFVGGGMWMLVDIAVDPAGNLPHLES